MDYLYLTLQVMASIERLTKQLFHDNYPELWEEWNRVSDTKNRYEQERAARVLYAKMCKALDSLNSDYVGI